MFRRRPRRRPLLRRPLPTRVHQALARANGMMAGGQFAEAAAIFERLSEKAQRRGMIVRAADLALRASRANFAAADVDAALGQAMRALRLFVRGDRVGRVPLLLSKMTGALRNKGYDAQADQLEREAARVLGEMGFSLDEARQQAPVFPHVKCHQGKFVPSNFSKVWYSFRESVLAAHWATQHVIGAARTYRIVPTISRGIQLTR